MRRGREGKGLLFLGLTKGVTKNPWLSKVVESGAATAPRNSLLMIGPSSHRIVQELYAITLPPPNNLVPRDFPFFMGVVPSKNKSSYLFSLPTFYKNVENYSLQQVLSISTFDLRRTKSRILALPEEKNVTWSETETYF